MFFIKSCPLLLEVMSCAVGGMSPFIGGYVRKYWRRENIALKMMSCAVGGVRTVWTMMQTACKLCQIPDFSVPARKTMR